MQVEHDGLPPSHLSVAPSAQYPACRQQGLAHLDFRARHALHAKAVRRRFASGSPSLVSWAISPGCSHAVGVVGVCDAALREWLPTRERAVCGGSWRLADYTAVAQWGAE